MWKTLYAIGLALPRILFRPSREFNLVIPERGSPFVFRVFPLAEQLTYTEKLITDSREKLREEVNIEYEMIWQMIKYLILKEKANKSEVSDILHATKVLIKRATQATTNSELRYILSRVRSIGDVLKYRTVITKRDEEPENTPPLGKEERDEE